jgi:nucleoside 2-deoxyribosyltransferase
MSKKWLDDIGSVIYTGEGITFDKHTAFLWPVGPKENLMMSPSFSVYMAGELFDHKDLVGNALLAKHIDCVSQGRYGCVLPQNIDMTDSPPGEIRDQDLKRLIRSDLSIFSFDGTELDSGTVVEFMVAKFLDIPSVIIRSDLRSSGDQGKDGDDWNLMCSFYPRTRIIRFNAMTVYQEAVRQNESIDDAIRELYGKMSSVIIENLDSVRRIPPLLKGKQRELEAVYNWALKFPGGGFEALCSEPSFVENLVAEKTDKGIA